MICVRRIGSGFRCDMCFQKPYYEIIADDRYNELPAFHLHLCKAHAAQLGKHISDALDFDTKEDERRGTEWTLTLDSSLCSRSRN